MFKIKYFFDFFFPKFGIVQVGGGSSSGSTQAVLTPEQREAIQAQTEALKNVFLPAYQQTQKGATAAYETVAPYMANSAKSGYELTGNVAQGATASGLGLLGTGSQGLKALFDPNYEEGQVQAALQAGRESARESQAGQNAMYGGAGGLGSSRMALADKNLYSLNAQRQSTAAAAARAGVQANKAAAAQSLMGAGSSLLTTGLGAAGQQLNMANAPMDLFSRYASVIYGVPQQSTTPNFAGTQGQNTSSSGWGGSVGWGSDINIKQNITKVGHLENGLSLYSFEYKPEYKSTWGDGFRIGVMAQEVEKVNPEAVFMHKDGYKLVNYAAIM